MPRDDTTMENYREGYLNKAGKGLIQTHLHSWRPRFFVLDSGVLKYYKTKETQAENMLGSIELTEIESVSLMKNEKHSFQITTKSPKSRTYYMSGKSDHEVLQWIESIQKAKNAIEKKTKMESAPASDLGVYDQVNAASQSHVGPPKPQRTPVFSEYALVGPPTGESSQDSSKSASLPNKPNEYESVGPKTQSNEPNSAGLTESQNSEKSASLPNQPISSEYEQVGGQTKNKESPKEDGDTLLAEDSTYAKVDQKRTDSSGKSTVGKTEALYDEPSVGDNLYDTVNIDKRQKPKVVVPPPLPSRYPSLSTEPESEPGPVREIRSMSEPSPALNPIGVYDEIRLPSTEGRNVDEKIAKEEKDGSTDKVRRSTTLPVYAKPMKKKNSKRKLNPNLMDIGEVSIEIEEETAGGKDSLKKGMIKPAGKRFAIEELKAILKMYDEENNNNEQSDVTFTDFDMNESESAFDLLRRFLEKYQ